MKKLLNYSFVTISLTHLLAISGDKAFDLLPKYFELQNFEASEVGFIMSFTGLGAIAVLPVFVFFIDRFKKKYIVYTAITAQLLIPILYFIPFSNPEFYGLPRFLQGAVYSILVITFTSMASFTIPRESRSQGLALFGLAGQGALVIGIGIGEILLDSFGFFYLYLFSAAVILCSLYFLSLFPEPEELKTGVNNPEKLNGAEGGIIEIFANAKNFPVIFWIFLQGAAYGVILAFLPKLAISNGLSYIRPFYIAFPGTVFIARLCFGRTFDLFPRNVTLGIPLVCMPLSLVFLRYSSSNSMLVLSGVLFGLCHALLYPVLLSMLMDYSTKSSRGRVVLVFRLFYHFGIFVSAYIGGYVATVSVTLLFISAAVFSTAGFVLWLLIMLSLVYSRFRP